MLWLVLLAVIIVFLYLKVIKKLHYWKERGVAYDKSWPMLGAMANMIFRKKHLMEIVQEIYNEFPNERYSGFHQFLQPVLAVRDLDLIKKITVKDFDHFTDHNPILTEEIDPIMGRNLLSLKGQRWRDMRATLSPTFTGSKMRIIFQLLCECSEQFTKYFEKQGSKEMITLDVKDVFTRFTNDAIATVAFGLKVNSLEEPNNEFYSMGKEVGNFDVWMLIKMIMMSVFPTLSKLLKLRFLPATVEHFFCRAIKDTLQQRELEGVVRPDMIHLLMEAKKGRLKHENVKDTIDAGFATVEESQVGKTDKPQKLQLSDEDIMGQALIFFFAGFESIATLMSFIAHELAVHPDVQEKLQTEVDETLKKCNGKLTYETLMEMKYLDMVVSETLRKWPPAIQMDRICVKEYTITPERPSEKPLTLEKGQLVVIHMAGIHHDPKLFPNPDKFDPERFSDENKHNINPASYMPFGVGPRNCIASRLALLENKTLFVHFISKFEVVPVEKTCIPLRLGKKTFKMAPQDGFWLGVRQRQIIKD